MGKINVSQVRYSDEVGLDSIKCEKKADCSSDRTEEDTKNTITIDSGLPLSQGYVNQDGDCGKKSFHNECQSY